MRFDFDEVFGDDYLYFFADRLPDEQHERDTDDVIRFLALQPGERILDAPCGHGRISNRLARRGLDVVGVDASAAFLGIARAAGAGAAYVRGDMRDLPVTGPFDAAISFFTSFGYFDDDGNRRVLAEYRRVLRPGGRLLIETHNRDEFVHRHTPIAGQRLEIGDDVRIDSSWFDCVEGRVETDRVVIRDGRTRRSHFSVRLPAITELRAWLAEAGFARSRFYARDGQPPALDRPRLVVVATA